MGEDIRNDAVLAGNVRQAGRVPFVPGRLEVVEQRAVVHRRDRVTRMLGRGDEPCLRERRPDRAESVRRLGRGRAHADPDLVARVVQRAALVDDNRHRERH